MNEPTFPTGGRASERAYWSIRSQILSGGLSGGEWLREEDLASTIGVSRTPIREALRRLAAEGLVRHERNRGVRVQHWSPADIDEVFELRSLLEPWAAKLAAERGTVDIDLLTELADDMDAAASGDNPDVDTLTTLNNRFHGAILAASGRSRLEDIVSSVVAIPLVWDTFARYSPAAMQRSLIHHREIIDALRARDPVWAESIMRAHIHAAWAFLRTDLTSPSGDQDSPSD